jgi:hypothetical protein
VVQVPPDDHLLGQLLRDMGQPCAGIGGGEINKAHLLQLLRILIVILSYIYDLDHDLIGPPLSLLYLTRALPQALRIKMPLLGVGGVWTDDYVLPLERARGRKYAP